MALLARRSLLIGIGASLAAPAIVRAANLMPVRSIARFDVDDAFVRILETFPDPPHDAVGVVQFWDETRQLILRHWLTPDQLYEGSVHVGHLPVGTKVRGVQMTVFPGRPFASAPRSSAAGPSPS